MLCNEYEAFDNLEDARVRSDGRIIVRRDLAYGKPLFYLFTDDDLVSYYKQNDHHSLHEVILDGNPCIFFVDFDKELDGENIIQYIDAVEAFKNEICKRTGKKIMWLNEDATKSTKFSRHIKTPDLVFKDVFELRKFVAGIVLDMKHKLLYGIIDWHLYHKNCTLRMYYSAKQDELERRLYIITKNNVIKSFCQDFLLKSILSRPNLKNIITVEGDPYSRLCVEYGIKKDSQIAPTAYQYNKSNAKKKAINDIDNGLKDNIIDTITTYLDSNWGPLNDEITLNNIQYWGTNAIDQVMFEFSCNFCAISAHNRGKGHKIKAGRALIYTKKTKSVLLICLNSNCKGKKVVHNDVMGRFDKLINNFIF